MSVCPHSHTAPLRMRKFRCRSACRFYTRAIMSSSRIQKSNANHAKRPVKKSGGPAGGLPRLAESQSSFRAGTPKDPVRIMSRRVFRVAWHTQVRRCGNIETQLAHLFRWLCSPRYRAQSWHQGLTMRLRPRLLVAPLRATLVPFPPAQSHSTHDESIASLKFAEKKYVLTFLDAVDRQ